jgi:hypothetical protein
VRLRSPLCCANSITFKIRPTISFLSHRNNTLLWLKDSNLRRGATQFGSWDRRYTCITIILLIMMEYPSRSNLNSFFWVLSVHWLRVMNSNSILKSRPSLNGENHYQFLSQGE